MARPAFLLSSDQLELLLAFEDSKGLAALAESMGRDPSVISRGLQRIAEEHPVLIKIRGKWELTPLGREINELTRSSIASYQNLLHKPVPAQKPKKYASAKSLLLIVNAQVGLLDATQLGRNNSDAEKNIASLLSHWRKNQRPVVHIKHVSDNPSSLFFRKSAGCEILPELTPLEGELVLEKTKSSAFAETSLENQLKQIEPEEILMVGFTANECIDATARDSAALGFTSFVIGDATAMFDVRDPMGKLMKAERIHKLTLANINAFYAKVLRTVDVVS